MFCTNCGHKVREGDNFCTSCGGRVGELRTTEIPINMTCSVTFFADAPKSTERQSDPFDGVGGRELKDLRTAKCPYCQKTLSKIPGAKTKCPQCHQFMYVRTRPSDYARAVVTAKDAKKIEMDYGIISGSREPDFRYITTASEVRAETARLTSSFKSKGYSEPSVDDVKWSILNIRILESASGTGGPDDRIIRYLMADFLARRWKLRDALAQYLLVCALDLIQDPNPSLAPAPLDQISRISRALNLSATEVREVFQRYYPARKGLTESESWTHLEKAIWPEPSTLSEPKHEPGAIARAPLSYEIEQTVSLPSGRSQKIWRDSRALINHDAGA